MLGSRISQKTLAKVSRSLSTMLHSGVDLIRSIKVVSKKSGDQTCRRRLADVALALERGEDLTQALNQQGDYFPQLYIDMVHVAESTGKLPEVLKEMADHYEKNIRLRQEFIGWIVWPLIQFFAAVFVVALLIYLMGFISSINGAGGSKGFDPLGFGLLGAEGAATWLAYVFCGLFGLFIVYMLVTRGLGQTRALHRLFLRVPVLGKALQSFAVARFSWGFFVTQDAGMPIAPSLEASLKATGNGAFAAAGPRLIEDVMAGDDLGVALDHTELFPDEYIHIVQVAETSGTVPEELHRLSPEFEAEARRSMRKMAVTASIIVWMMVAALIIFLIFRIVLWYLGMLNDALQGV